MVSVSDVEFWRVLSAIAWPVAAVLIVLVLRQPISRLLQREGLTIRVAGLEVGVERAVEITGTGLVELQERVARLESGSTPKPIGGAGFSILWVDDTPSNNAFLIDHFKNDGIEVILSLSTADALEQIEKKKPDALISDLGRKEGGRANEFAGLDLLKSLAIKAIRLPTVIYSGPRGMKNAKELKNAGALEVIDSGVELIRFVDRIRQG